MKDNIARLLLATLVSQDSAIALDGEGDALTRRQLMALVNDQAHGFLNAGLASGDFIVVLCDRGHRFWIELLAGWVIGARVVCVESGISGEHAASIVAMTGACHVACDGVPCPEGLGDLQSLKSVDAPSRATGSAAKIFQDLPFAHDTPDIAGLIFTSGTTGLPKGVPLSHRALGMNALSTATRLRLRADDRLLLATPYRFISSISHFIVTLMSGATLVGIERRLLIKDLIDAMNAHRITAFGGSPFHMQFIAMAGKGRLPLLRWAMSSGDHLRVHVIEQIFDAFDDLELHVVYGMAELGGRFCSLPPERLGEKAGSVGLPLPGLEFTIRDGDGAVCAPGVTGDVHVSGMLEFEGYFANPAANAEVLGVHGFRNGDVGHVDEDGFLFLSGRSDAVFKRSGLKVSAQVITDALNQLPDITDAHAVGEEDAVEGHVPIAYIVWADGKGMEDGALTVLLRETLPTNHIPRRYIALPGIPRTGSGKVDRRGLAALIADTAAP